MWLFPIPYNFYFYNCDQLYFSYSDGVFVVLTSTFSIQNQPALLFPASADLSLLHWYLPWFPHELPAFFFCLSKEKIICMFADLHNYTSAVIHIALLETSVYIYEWSKCRSLNVVEISQISDFLSMLEGLQWKDYNVVWINICHKHFKQDNSVLWM